MDYFAHDAKAMSDDKLLALRIDKGLAAVAVYWVMLEKIYSDERPFEVSETNVEARSVLLRLGLGFEEFADYVFHMCDIGLLERDPNNPEIVMSRRAAEHIAELNRKRETARQNGKSGGRKPKSVKSGNQGRTKVGSKAKPKSGDIKTLNVIGFDKQNQITRASVGAAVAEATPPSADDTKIPCCPLCSKRLKFDPSTLKWSCEMCGEVKEPDYREAIA